MVIIACFLAPSRHQEKYLKVLAKETLCFQMTGERFICNKKDYAQSTCWQIMILLFVLPKSDYTFLVVRYLTFKEYLHFVNYHSSKYI